MFQFYSTIAVTKQEGWFCIDRYEAGFIFLQIFTFNMKTALCAIIVLLGMVLRIKKVSQGADRSLVP